ncbi:hypothetical protein CDD82_7522 [Ophiocordyceps australis]|uniref:Uncharacterized protein n=1 Tax=Ophiocordyceps australis TaxID=1399860 RepID=A0A2C5ZQ28_9HYPO|nr:hypothetical protein CDD82_7522 [Ophiocordyceps australis]
MPRIKIKVASRGQADGDNGSKRRENIRRELKRADGYRRPLCITHFDQVADEIGLLGKKKEKRRPKALRRQPVRGAKVYGRLRNIAIAASSSPDRLRVRTWEQLDNAIDALSKRRHVLFECAVTCAFGPGATKSKCVRCNAAAAPGDGHGKAPVANMALGPADWDSIKINGYDRIRAGDVSFTVDTCDREPMVFVL